MRDPWSRFDAEVQSLLSQALSETAPEAPEPLLEVPPQGIADRGYPCFPLAKLLKKAPPQIAQDLATLVADRLPSGLVARCEAVGGYVNFHADRLAIARSTFDTVRQAGPAFGQGDPKGQRVILEHTSANPNGPLHVGRARNPILGDTMGRALRKAGWDVEVQYYVDDLGKQVAMLAWGIENVESADLPAAARDKRDHDLVRFYQAANEKAEQDESVEEQIQAWVRRSEEADAEILKRFEAAYEPVLEGMLESLKRIGVEFDSFVKESRFVANGATARVIDRLNATELSGEDIDGGRFLDLKGRGIHGRSQRFVYQRRDGTSLYATRDIAYHLWKSEQADRLINVLGEDHKLQAKQVRIALEILGAKRIPEVVFYAFVSLPEGKMSTRRGRVVFLDDLIDEAVERAYEEVKKRRGGELDEEEMRRIAEAVGVGALRYNIVRVQAEKAIQFKWEEALNFEGASAPFVQYAYARCASILRKAETDEMATGPDPDPNLVQHEAEIDLLATVARLPAIVQEAADTDRPHVIASFAQDLANALNAFYRDCPVLAAEDPVVRATRLAIVTAAKDVLATTLELVGVPVLETM